MILLSRAAGGDAFCVTTFQRKTKCIPAGPTLWQAYGKRDNRCLVCKVPALGAGKAAQQLGALGCSPRGPEFGSQDLCQVTHNYL